jgi:hypothetical protein
MNCKVLNIIYQGGKEKLEVKKAPHSHVVSLALGTQRWGR